MKARVYPFITQHQEDIVYHFLQAKKHIFDWKAHILRSEHQDLAKQDVLRSLHATSALITKDWAMKFQCQKFELACQQCCSQVMS